jgi:cellulose synthase/poly-beta-1,6-N-acetylglucosamine synthase-like glycosyltransferase
MWLALILYNMFRFGFAAVFVGLHCVLMAGLFLEWRRDKRAGGGVFVHTPALDSADVPASGRLVSVIIPVRNEALRMEGLLRTLGLQDCPGAEYIFVDDRSFDESPALLRRFAGTREDVRIITLTENPGPNHKQYALSRGIAIARGELLLFTDADCEVPPSWIRSMILRMTDKRAGAVIGPVFKLPELPAAFPAAGNGKGFFQVYQCFDHAIRYMYLAASTGIGAAGGGFGNNLILRRETLDFIGGYEGIPPSPTEDAALISQIRAKSAYQVRSACGADVFVMTRGEQSWGSLINQTLRWNNGGLFSPELSTRLNFGFLMITISMGMLAIPLLPFIPSLWPLPGAVFLAMTMNTLATLHVFGAAIPKAGPAWIFHTIFTPLYFTFLTILGFLGIKPSWKGEEENHNEPEVRRTFGSRAPRNTKGGGCEE